MSMSTSASKRRACGAFVLHRMSPRLVCLRIMRFLLGRCAAILAGIAVMVICSCEKHHVGEIPEVQKEHSDPAQESGQTEPRRGEMRVPSTPPAAPTPAEFFSPTKP